MSTANLGWIKIKWKIWNTEQDSKNSMILFQKELIIGNHLPLFLSLYLWMISNLLKSAYVMANFAIWVISVSNLVWLKILL